MWCEAPLLFIGPLTTGTASCSPLTGFSALRAYALCQSKALTVLIFLLTLVSFGVNVVRVKFGPAFSSDNNPTHSIAVYCVVRCSPRHRTYRHLSHSRTACNKVGLSATGIISRINSMQTGVCNGSYLQKCNHSAHIDQFT